MAADAEHIPQEDERTKNYLIVLQADSRLQTNLTHEETSRAEICGLTRNLTACSTRSCTKSKEKEFLKLRRCSSSSNNSGGERSVIG